VSDPRPQRSRALALDAARKLLFSEGLDALTHVNLARASGLGRKTLYRHFPTPRDLVRSVLSTRDLPHAVYTGDVKDDVTTHLELLRRALFEGPLSTILGILIHRSALDADLMALRMALIAEGCAPLRKLLRAAKKQGSLPGTVDIEALCVRLEGPVFYRALVQNKTMRAADVKRLVATVLDV
jgi:AcrR family transcriptional regulator